MLVFEEKSPEKAKLKHQAHCKLNPWIIDEGILMSESNNIINAGGIMVVGRKRENSVEANSIHQSFK